MVKEQEIINATWSRGATNYNTIIDDEIGSFRTPAWQSQILDNAPQKECLDILDCGCGPGFFSCILAMEGHRVRAIDGSDAMLDYAQSRAERLGLSVEFDLMDCHELTFDDDSFDLVVSRNVTHTLRDHETVYRQWQRVLRPGGVLLIFDANWHLTRYGQSEYEESVRRHIECMKTYGSDFNGNVYDGDEEALRKKCTEYSPGERDTWDHALKGRIRPDWDAGLLQGIGFAEVTYDRDIIEDLWDDKEKLIYGNTPMFMIRAVKK